MTRFPDSKSGIFTRVVLCVLESMATMILQLVVPHNLKHSSRISEHSGEDILQSDLVGVSHGHRQGSDFIGNDRISLNQLVHRHLWPSLHNAPADVSSLSPINVSQCTKGHWWQLQLTNRTKHPIMFIRDGPSQVWILCGATKGSRILAKKLISVKGWLWIGYVYSDVKTQLDDATSS